MTYPGRLMRNLGAELKAVLRGSTATHGHLRDRLMSILVATVIVDLICATLAIRFEHAAPGTQIRTFGDALFWTSCQLLTVSSQLPNPLSTAGRVLDVAMEAYAITVVATLAASIGAFLMRRGHELAVAAALERAKLSRRPGPAPGPNPFDGV